MDAFSRRLILIAYVFAALSFPRGAVAAQADLKGCAYYFAKFVEVVKNPDVYVSWEWLDRLGFKMRLAKHHATKTKMLVRLADLHPNHALNTIEAQGKTRERAERLLTLKDEVLRKGRIDASTVGSVMPSQSDMMVVRDRYGNFILMEGVGRYFAFKEVFGAHPDVLIEVDFVDHRGDRVVTGTLDRLLRINHTRVPAPDSPPLLIQP